MIFPQELIHEVIKNFTPSIEEELDTLTACSLVSRSFLSESRAILFREVCVSSELQPYAYRVRRERKESVVATFCKLIAFNSSSTQSTARAGAPTGGIWTRFQLPPLSALVNCLHLDCASLPDRVTYDERDGISDLLDILSSIPNLRELRIFGASSTSVTPYYFHRVMTKSMDGSGFHALRRAGFSCQGPGAWVSPRSNRARWQGRQRRQRMMCKHLSSVDVKALLKREIQPDVASRMEHAIYCIEPQAGSSGFEGRGMWTLSGARFSTAYHVGVILVGGTPTVGRASESLGTFTDIDPLPIALEYLDLDLDYSMPSHSPCSRSRITNMILPGDLPASEILSVFDMKALRGLRSLTLRFSIDNEAQITSERIKYVFTCLGFEENQALGSTTFTVSKNYLNLRMVTIQAVARLPRSFAPLGSSPIEDRCYLLIDTFASSLEFVSSANNRRDGDTSPSPFSQNVPRFQLCLLQDRDQSRSLPDESDPFQATIHACISLFPLSYKKGILQFVIIYKARGRDS
jgi:hypothetical protein